MISTSQTSTAHHGEQSYDELRRLYPVRVWYLRTMSHANRSKVSPKYQARDQMHPKATLGAQLLRPVHDAIGVKRTTVRTAKTYDSPPVLGTA